MPSKMLLRRVSAPTSVSLDAQGHNAETCVMKPQVVLQSSLHTITPSTHHHTSTSDQPQKGGEKGVGSTSRTVQKRRAHHLHPMGNPAGSLASSRAVDAIVVPCRSSDLVRAR